jgi:hypothetical protein
MCHNAHVAFGIFPLPWFGYGADLWVFAAAVVGRADLPLEVHRADFPLLGLGFLRQRDNGNRHHMSLDLAILTSLASLADFALLE